MKCDINLKPAPKAQCAIQNVVGSVLPEDEENKPYCTDCGNDDLAYLDQYANGDYWKCKECGKEFIH